LGRTIHSIGTIAPGGKRCRATALGKLQLNSTPQPAAILQPGNHRGDRSMGQLHELRSQLLRDRRITDDEVEIIRQHIREDGQLDLDDVKFLVELLSEAVEVSPEFDRLFFPVLKQVILQDGRIGQDEQFYLMKMLYSDGHLRDSERELLKELQREAEEVSPQFQAMCDEALQAHSTDWQLGGR
jgi:hypothetical protein